MTVHYLVILGIEQVYLDQDLKRCAPPDNASGEKTAPMHFVRFAEDGALLSTNWDIGLAQFTAEQRRAAQVWKRDEAGSQALPPPPPVPPKTR